MPLPSSVFDWLLRWSDVIGTVGSLLLSGLLVYFYAKMRSVQQTQAEIQDEQSRILENQTEISRADHEPELRIIDISSEKPDRINLDIENIGNGIATDLTLVCIVETDNDYFDVQPTRTPLVEVGDSLDVRRSLTTDPDDGGTFFADVPILLRGNGRFTETLSRFSTAMAKLQYTGTYGATVHLTLEYQNILDDTRSKPIRSSQILVNGTTSLEDVLRTSIGDMADGLPQKRGSSLLETRHLGQNGPFDGSERVEIEYRTQDLWPSGYKLTLDVETPAGVTCEIERGNTHVETVAEATETTVTFGRDENELLEHGELVHIFAVNGDHRWEIELIGAADLPPQRTAI